MIRQLKCECGILIRSHSDDEAVVEALDHIATNHPAIADLVKADDIRNWIELVPG